jgi:peptidoglycan-associated lipoprotein
MTSYRIVFLAALAAGATACAGHGKAVKASTDVVDAAPAAPTAPVAAAEPPLEKGACRADSDCGDGESCTAGRCVAAAATCEPVRVHFAFDSSQLDGASTEALRESARCIAERKAQSLLVEGHCDERGTQAYNIALGARRAEVVKRYLANLGVSAHIETVSFGAELPLVQGSDEKAWAQNRRAEVKLPGEKRSDGGVVAAAR